MTETLLPMKAPAYRPAREGVSGKVGMAAPTIYELIRKGEFPAPVKRGRSSLWIESEIDAWIADLKEHRDRGRSAR